MVLQPSRRLFFKVPFVDDIRNALAENPEAAALIRHNVRMLREQFEETQEFR
jgi:hypothetical protein